MSSMPVGVNHAAFGTDGRRLFVFGGRDGKSVAAEAMHLWVASSRNAHPEHNPFQAATAWAPGLIIFRYTTRRPIPGRPA